MITQKQNRCQISWQKAQQQSFSNPLKLLDFLEIPPSVYPDLLFKTPFAFKVPYSFAQRMQKRNIHDPLLRQVLPLMAENDLSPEYHLDPVGDQKSIKQPGLLHKYPGRVLLTTTSACAMHCRYCFRRYFPYHDANPLQHNWQTSLDYIAQSSDIHEIILSGGDPLSLSNTKLQHLLHNIHTLTHIQRLRIHTRNLIVLPERIDTGLIQLLSHYPKPIIIVLHINHANEINDQVVRALLPLRQQTHITLLNQSVLLKGVNDNLPALQQLSETLFNTGILPYYLHLLDKVQGAKHFAVNIEKAKYLLHALQNSLSGFLVPKLVTEITGEQSKTPV